MQSSKKKINYYDKKPDLSEQGTSKIRVYFRNGMTAFIVVAACIVCYFAFLRFSLISSWIREVISIIQPVIYGLVIAYLLNPMVKKIEKYTASGLRKIISNEEAIQKLARSIGILGALVIAVAVITALLNMVIPELFKSIRNLMLTLPDQISDWIEDLNAIQENNSPVGQLVKTALLQGGEALENWVKTDLLKQTNVLMSSVTAGVINVVSGVMNIVIGLIVSVYVLSRKEQFLGQCRKMIYALMTPKRANLTLHILRKSNEIFGGFIIGKIIDSAIIGVLCFIGVSVLKMPYALLVSVIVGVTNVIPFFGPYIGAIPSAILILLVDPVKGLYFIIFILLLQQLDGNVIGPKILGNSTGLSAFWVVFAILVGGGLFGIVGMIIGVPAFAVIYYIVQMFINQRLEQKHLPTETACYNDNNYVDDEGNFISSEDEKAETEKITEKGE